MDKKLFQQQIQNLRNKRFANEKLAKAIVEKTEKGTVKLSSQPLAPRIVPVKKINQKAPAIINQPTTTSKKGCGCGRKR